MADELNPKQSHYFSSDSRFFRLLRLLNLMEPGIAVLSVSKLLLWIMTAALIYTVIYSPGDTLKMIGAVSGFTASAMNYSYRRWRNEK